MTLRFRGKGQPKIYFLQELKKIEPWSRMGACHLVLVVHLQQLFICSHSLSVTFPISDCQWECEESVEPVGAAVCVWGRCTDSEPEPVLCIDLAWRSGEAAVRAGGWMERLLCRRNLQPPLASPYQHYRYVWVLFSEVWGSILWKGNNLFVLFSV